MRRRSLVSFGSKDLGFGCLVTGNTRLKETHANKRYDNIKALRFCRRPGCGHDL